MIARPEFFPVFEELRSILKSCSLKLTVKADTSNEFSLYGAYCEKWKKELLFGAAQIKKNYVSFYLMPVYMYPSLLANISPELKKHMQGKSCFNFKKVEKNLFDELTSLTKQSFEQFMQEYA